MRGLINSGLRYGMWHYLSGPLKLILVSEFPKSGGSWLCQLLSEITELPFPRNEWPRLQASIMHGHYQYNSRFRKPILLIRDGRDVMVSAYHHFLFPSNGKPKSLIKDWQSLMPFDDYVNVKDNLSVFIKVFSDKFTVGGQPLNWSNHLISFEGIDDLHIIKYEDMIQDTNAELEKVLKYLDNNSITNDIIDEAVHKYSFQNQSKRNPGEEDKSSFLRKGIVGDWKNHFDQKSKEVFNQLHGKTLIRFGYENNFDW